MWCLSPISVAKAGPWPSQMDEMGHTERSDGRTVSTLAAVRTAAGGSSGQFYKLFIA